MSRLLPPPLRTPAFPEWWPAETTAPQPVTKAPRITVVTPSFNQAAYLESAIRSVLSQNYPNLDYIIVDGGSRDGSVDIIRHYSAHLSSWVSEPDRGQTDAIRKGLERSTGEWFNWINSDDLLAPGALWRVSRGSPGVDVVAGSVVNFSARGPRGVSRCRRFSMQPMIFQHLGGGTKYHQPGVWLRREALASVGINQNRHYKFDYEVLLRYLHRFPRVRYLTEVLAFFRLHEQSKTITQGAQHVSAFHQEHVDILNELAREPEFRAVAGLLDLAARQCSWIVELPRYAGYQGSRWRGLAQLWREARTDPAARCIRHTRKTALRLLRQGFWPYAWTKAARERL